MPKKKKKEKTFEIETKVEIMFTAREWAIQEGLNPVLFEKWKDEVMTKKEFDKLKQEVM